MMKSLKYSRVHDATLSFSSFEGPIPRFDGLRIRSDEVFVSVLAQVADLGIHAGVQ